MTGYIVEFEDGLQEELNKVMPGVTWKTWRPVFSDLVEHGKLVGCLADKLSRHLHSLPTTVGKIATRKLKVDLHAEQVDKNTWLRSIHKSLAENPQWKLEDRSLLRLAS